MSRSASSVFRVSLHLLTVAVALKKTVQLQVVSGGLCCQSGVAIAELGDKNDDMLIAVAAVTVGY